MFFGFMLLALFFSLRSTSYGNDLARYEMNFNELTWKMLNYLDDKKSSEISWAYLNLLFKPFGFRCFVFFNTFLLCGTMYYLIKRFVPPMWYWFAVFVFLFDTNQFLINLSMLRQSMSISLCALSFVFMYDKKRLLSILLLVIACTIHRSTYIMIPFFLIVLINSEKILRWSIVAIAMMLLLFIFSAGLFTSYLMEILSTDMVHDAFGEHLSLLEETSSGIGAGLMLQILASISLLLVWKDMEIMPKKMVLFFMFYFACCFASLYLVLLFRFGYYFLIWGNLVYPIAFSLLEKKKKYAMIKNMSKLFLTICIIYTYYGFFTDSVYSKYFKNFEFCF